jgi:RNA polymerase sigma-70 factor, ECF subfamily
MKGTAAPTADARLRTRGIETARQTEQAGGTTGAHDWGALFDHESERLYRSLYAYSGGRRAVAEDATVEAFARGIAQGDRVREPVAWLYRTAFRVAAADLKRDAKRTEQPEETVEPETGSDPQVLDALRSLPSQQRTAAVLHYIVDLPVDEVASRMGIASATVKVHLFRARKHLRALLEVEEVDPGAG